MIDTTQEFIAAGCILRWDNRYVFEIQSPEKWHHDPSGSPVLGVGCIGGGIESGETVIEAVQRESLEEIGCTVTLRSSDQTFDVTPAGVRTRTDLLFGRVRPVMTCELLYEGFVPGKKVAVFLGTPDGSPEPGDLPAIILAKPGQIFGLGHANLSIDDLKNSGAEIRSRIDLPEHAQLELTGILSVIHMHELYASGWFV